MPESTPSPTPPPPTPPTPPPFFSSSFFLFFFEYLFVPCGKFGWPYPGNAQQPQEQRCSFLSVCSIFLCVQTMVWLLVFGSFNTDVDDAIAYDRNKCIEPV